MCEQSCPQPFAIEHHLYAREAAVAAGAGDVVKRKA